MTPLPVFLSRRAQQDIEDDYDWWAKYRSSGQALRWREVCERAIDSLPQRGERCSLAPESNDFPFVVRQLQFGLGRKPTHRAVFTIRKDMILVLRVRHLAQDDLALDEV